MNRDIDSGFDAQGGDDTARDSWEIAEYVNECAARHMTRSVALRGLVIA